MLYFLIQNEKELIKRFIVPLSRHLYYQTFSLTDEKHQDLAENHPIHYFSCDALIRNLKTNKVHEDLFLNESTRGKKKSEITDVNGEYLDDCVYLSKLKLSNIKYIIPSYENSDLRFYIDYDSVHKVKRTSSEQLGDCQFPMTISFSYSSFYVIGFRPDQIEIFHEIPNISYHFGGLDEWNHFVVACDLFRHEDRRQSLSSFHKCNKICDFKIKRKDIKFSTISRYLSLLDFMEKWGFVEVEKSNSIDRITFTKIGKELLKEMHYR